MTFTLTRSRAPETPPLAPGVAARALGATKVYGQGVAEVRALDGVTVDFATGHFTAIMGPSGSGKSTLLHALAGLDTLTDGSVWIGATELGRLSDKKLTKLRRDHIGFVFQSFNLIPTLTAAENITLPMKLAGRTPDAEWLATVVATVGLGSRLRHRPSELSGGQQQRVAVARALASRPQIVLADEPTGNLDSRSTADVLALLRELHSSGRTIVLITHEQEVADAAGRTVRLHDGLVVGRPGPASPLGRVAAS
jgi:putative ABC transport system ATP-binding protein